MEKWIEKVLECWSIGVIESAFALSSFGGWIGGGKKDWLVIWVGMQFLMLEKTKRAMIHFPTAGFANHEKQSSTCGTDITECILVLLRIYEKDKYAHLYSKCVCNKVLELLNFILVLP